jgi:hypothetical protein
MVLTVLPDCTACTADHWQARHAAHHVPAAGPDEAWSIYGTACTAA